MRALSAASRRLARPWQPDDLQREAQLRRVEDTRRPATPCPLLESPEEENGGPIQVWRGRQFRPELVDTKGPALWRSPEANASVALLYVAAIEQGVVDALRKAEVDIIALLYCFDHINTVSTLSLKAFDGMAAKLTVDVIQMRSRSYSHQRVRLFLQPRGVRR